MDNQDYKICEWLKPNKTASSHYGTGCGYLAPKFWKDNSKDFKYCPFCGGYINILNEREYLDRDVNDEL